MQGVAQAADMAGAGEGALVALWDPLGQVVWVAVVQEALLMLQDLPGLRSSPTAQKLEQEAGAGESRGLCREGGVPQGAGVAAASVAATAAVVQGS